MRYRVLPISRNNVHLHSLRFASVWNIWKLTFSRSFHQTKPKENFVENHRYVNLSCRCRYFVPGIKYIYQTFTNFVNICISWTNTIVVNSLQALCNGNSIDVTNLRIIYDAPCHFTTLHFDHKANRVSFSFIKWQNVLCCGWCCIVFSGF